MGDTRFSIRGFWFLACLILLAGCRERKESADNVDTTDAREVAAAGMYQEQMFTYAVDNLNRLEQFIPPDALQQMLKRLQAKQTAADLPDPLLATWPEPEMLRQIVDRLTKWARVQTPPADWKLDPMVAALPKPLADLPPVKTLEDMRFFRLDGYLLQEAVWLRDIGLWARGEQLDDLERVKNLFDWTVRNIQLEPEAAERTPLLAWETLLFGRGTAAERAWVFVLLARQSGIDAALLTVGEPLRLWCAAALIQGQAYLFDPMLGLPIPAPNGISTDATGQLVIQPATLAQVVADEKLLADLTVNDKYVYDVKAPDLKRIVVQLEASPTYVARRMKLLESRLAGSQKMVLSTSPTTQAERWKAIPQVAESQLWLRPYETLDRRLHLDLRSVQQRIVAMLPFYGLPNAPLRRGRALHLKGKFVGEDGATQYYQQARPSNEELNTSSADPIEKAVYLRGKQDASYWLGLIAFQRQNYESAIHYFTRGTLLFIPKGPWIDGAHYSLGRTFEIAGDPERAALQYEGNDGSPGYLGCLLRAKWLREEMAKKKAAPQ